MMKMPHEQQVGRAGLMLLPHLQWMSDTHALLHDGLLGEPEWLLGELRGAGKSLLAQG